MWLNHTSVELALNLLGKHINGISILTSNKGNQSSIRNDILGEGDDKGRIGGKIHGARHRRNRTN